MVIFFFLLFFIAFKVIAFKAFERAIEKRSKKEEAKFNALVIDLRAKGIDKEQYRKENPVTNLKKKKQPFIYLKTLFKMVGSLFHKDTL